MHGIKVNELITGTRAIQAVSTAIIGLVATAPAAEPEIKAKLLNGVIASNNAQTFTAKGHGATGNGVTLALVNPQANNAALSIVVTGQAIVANLATGAGGAITTTATLLAAAIAANANANALVSVANTGASSGAGIVTALAAKSLAGGRDEAFPLGERTLITDVRAAIAKAGATGTLKIALEAIADQTNPPIVLVRVAVGTGIGEDPSQDELTIAGIQKLLGAQSQLGLRPRIIGAPGLDTQEVTAELALVGRQLRAMAYAMAEGDTLAEAITYRGEFGARELMLLWPGFTGGAADTVARAMGLRARIDQEIGWHKTLSNIVVDGVTGLAQDVSFDITGESHDAALLNAAGVTTMIRHTGYRFWGNRTCSDEPLFAFESAVRTAQVLQDEIAEGLMWAIDKPLTRVLISDIIETINARFRTLVSEGRLIGANAWYDPSLNSESDLAAGKLTIDYDFTPCAPLESLTLNQRITDRYYASFAELAA
jgi:phage tail sheath protein FI